MAEITQEAYTDLREYIQSNWDFISLKDNTDQEVLRVDSNDSRVTSTIEGDKVKLTIVVRGTDQDITLPSTFAKSEIYKVATGGSPLSIEPFTAFTMESENDELTVNHYIEVPKA
ncbi:hypothetical protein CD798_07985 [Bacillaceae bacterium SAOS 7]|nr:hypothetical protein CD798_07985 [Bacillaceae bacterium SAOS 7]